MPKRWHIIANLHFFLPPRGKFRATNAEYHCHNTFIFATYLNGGKSFSGPWGPLPLAACHKPQGAYAYTV